MCEPLTIAALSAQGAAGLFGAVSSLQEGEYQAEIAEYNARVAENEATRTRMAGTDEELRHREQVASFKATQKATQAASGVDVDSGSALQIREDTDLLGELDALRIRSNTDQRVEGLQTQAQFARDEGRAAKKSSRFKAFTSLLGSAGSGLSTGASLSSKWYNPRSAASQ